MSEWFEEVKAEFITNFIDGERWRFLADGLLNTLQLTVVACLIGIAIGIVVAAVRSSWDKNHETMRPGIGRFFLGVANAICKVYLPSSGVPLSLCSL